MKREVLFFLGFFGFIGAMIYSLIWDRESIIREGFGRPQTLISRESAARGPRRSIPIAPLYSDGDVVGQKPDKGKQLFVRFYSFNSLYEGAMVSLKNVEGKVMWIQLPGQPMVAGARPKWPGRLGGFDISVAVDSDFDLTRGFDMVVHFKNGTATRFKIERFERVGPWGNNFYLGEGLRLHVFLKEVEN